MRKRRKRNQFRSNRFKYRKPRKDKKAANQGRRLPSLYHAKRLWGEDNVTFDAPRYVGAGCCCYCGDKLAGRRRAFCSDACRSKFYRFVVWERGRGSYSTHILRRDGFTCTECGEIHAMVNEHGIRMPVSDGELDVHHIKPVSMGGGHEPSNLRTLCRECHKRLHEARRKAGLRA